MQLSAFVSAFKTPDLRKKLLFTMGIIAIYRLGSVVPVPGVDYTAVQNCVDNASTNPLFGLVNLFSGGALLQLSVFALGIMPYITASIIIQLLTVVIPRLEALKEEGQTGQAKITQYTRYLTIGLAILQSTGIVALARVPGRLIPGCNEQLIPDQNVWLVMVMIITMTAGTGVIMWLGEIITDKGVGNGMSLLIFTSIIATFPARSPASGTSTAGSSRPSPWRSGSSRSWAWCSSSRPSAASRCSTPSGWSADGCTAGLAPTSRSRSTWQASSPSSSPRRCCTSRS